MSKRLDKAREAKLKPLRMQVAMRELQALELNPEQVDDVTIRFQFKCSTVTYFPFTGWATGKTIQDGRGLKPLLKQLKA